MLTPSDLTPFNEVLNKKPFKVSARTARLIGRENVSNADGALIELVKNAYDADSPTCILLFDIIYNQIPIQIDPDNFSTIASSIQKETKNILELSYQLTDSGFYKLKENLEKAYVEHLEQFFKSYNTLYILDSGEGMTEDVIDKHWMTIGTNHKLTDVFTQTGRVKAGAKGIGRFALDRLGKVCTMITFPKDKRVSHVWEVNWEDFDVENAVIGEINANFNTSEDGEFRKEILDIVDNPQVEDVLDSDPKRFKNGTLLRISHLRDWWSVKELETLFNNLQNLSPPSNRQKFDIYLFEKAKPDNFGKVKNEEFKDFDYRVVAHVKENKAVDITVYRDEFQYNRIDKNLFKRAAMSASPYDEETFKKKRYVIHTSINELLPWLSSSDRKDEADHLKEFSFEFYFIKLSATENDKNRFSYKGFTRLTRSEWFKKFGGIKIYRDHFRVRPYGEIENTAFDWLLLGDRQSKSPAAVTKKGAGWRVGPNQVSGIVSITRLANLKFEDKSSREGFQENETFSVFKDLLLAIIHEFEVDRHTVMREMDLLFREKQEEEEARIAAEELLEREREVQERKENSNEKTDSSQEVSEEEPPLEDINYKEERDTYKKAFEAVKSNLEDAEEEVRILSALATTGLIVTSFAHEFSSFQIRLATHTNYLERELNQLLDKDKVSREVPSSKNPFLRLEKLRASHVGINQWLSIALAAVRKDKRLSDEIDIKKYLDEFEIVWAEVLNTRKVTMEISSDLKEDVKITAFIIDIDSIFNNLLVNSFDAFDVDGFTGARNIHINLSIFESPEDEKSYLQIIYKDSGPGLNEKIQNPNLILRRGYTTKVDKSGNEKGTGLGMWLVNDAIIYYGGMIKINRPKSGFEIYLQIPL